MRVYRVFFSVVLTRIDPERAHQLAVAVIRVVGLPVIGPVVHRFTRPDPSLRTETLGLVFPSPFGVAAGFDKNGEMVRGLGRLGFGHIEVGTVTAVAQPGNPRPRLFRLVRDEAVINRMGFNNRGARVVTGHLRRERSRSSRPVIGANIGKSRVVDVDDAIHDYLASTRLLAPVSDYLAVNVSSPNTPGLRGLQELDRLRPLLSAVRDAAGGKPVLVKIAPDLTDDEIRRIAGLVSELELAGIIATNTTLSRDGLRTPQRRVVAAGAGGLSGRPLTARSLEVLRVIRTVLDPSTCVISVGGVFDADDVASRLAAGATLVQGYTGFLYRGPLWARQINRGLVRRRAGRQAIQARPVVEVDPS